ncbi:hypothetical protein DL238_13980 [Alteriqipengyuania lutimaris]|uniref:Uncharacterized protein n=2 Tax=Alteriqipengyuania lutimaris TaxID=1538146 RepID=A0A395LIL2_9SPHN|nr:hypothetical protein DL238_13980 [Alteriqipengyuania lutimaris]
MAGFLFTAACSDAAPEADSVEPVPEETRAPLEFVARYKAFLYEPDHAGPSGEQLTEAWQVLREDRANYHARDVRQADDESDPVFASAANRERIEEMVAKGNLTAESARKIVERNVLVAVDIYERDGEPARLDVSVY